VQYRGRSYNMDSSEGEAFTRYYYGDLMTFMASTRDMNQLNARTHPGNRSYAPMPLKTEATSIAGLDEHDRSPFAVFTDYEVFRNQYAPGAINAANIVKQNFANHTITFPKLWVDGSVYDITYSTEYEMVIEVKKR